MQSAIDATNSLCFNPSVKQDAFIALGSNLGDREQNLFHAIAEIGKLPASRITGLSKFYETSPVGITDQPAFINAVLRLSTGITPLKLLIYLQQIESVIFERKQQVRWGPRKMDLDLLLYGDQIFEQDNLTVPHPRMAERRFVLQPLSDIAPDLNHPVLGATILELLTTLRSEEIVLPI